MLHAGGDPNVSRVAETSIDFDPPIRIAAALLGAPSASRRVLEPVGARRLGVSGVSWPPSDDEAVALRASRQPAPLAVLDTSEPDHGALALAAAGIAAVVTVQLREG